MRAFGPVVIAVLSTALAGYYLDRNFQNAGRIDLRSQAMESVSARAADLQTRIRRDLASVDAIEQAVNNNALIDEAGLHSLSKRLFFGDNDVLKITVFKDDRALFEASRDDQPVSDPPRDATLPLESTAPIRPSSGEARFSNIFVAAPSTYGLQVVVPLFSLENGRLKGWGSAAIVIDASRLFKATRLSYVDDKEFHYVVRPEKGADTTFKPFFRADEVRTVFASDPVVSTVPVLNTEWQVAAIPVGGWGKPPAGLAALRAGIVVFSAMFLIPLIIGARFRMERYSTIERLKRREQELEDVTRRLDIALESYRCGVWEAIVNVEETLWDERMHELHGVHGKAGWASRRSWLNFIHPDDREGARETLVKAIETCSKFSHQCRVVHPDGTIRHIRYVGLFQEMASGEQKLFGMAIDVSEDVALTDALRNAKTETDKKNDALQSALNELRLRESELKEVSQRLKFAVDSYGCGIWESNLDADVHFWDTRMHEMFGVTYTDGFTDKSIWLERIHPDDKDKTHELRQHAISTGERFSATYRILPTNAPMRHLHAVGQLHVTPEGERKFIGISIDVTDEKQRNDALIAAKNEAEARQAELEAAHKNIQYNAMHDPLTGLANRRALDEELDRLAQEERAPGGRVTLLHLDLDRFKQINDTLGHAAGDAMLIHAAKVLAGNVRRSDLVARIGGDEFVILMQNDASNKDIAILARRIIESMTQPVLFEGHECRFGVSIGIAREQSRKSSVRKLMVNADIALYRAKAHGRNRAEFFTSNLQAEIRRTKQLADEILRGIENDEFRPWYQPQFDSHTHELTGVEALVRWNHPSRGVLAPDAFLKTAEEINAVEVLDRIVLETALTDRLRWISKGLIVPKISVNVSARRLRDDMLIKSLKDLPISKGQIAFELVESIFLDDDDDVITRNIRRLKALGIDIEIDDFGTGHTSIVSLLKLEPKRLKIDRQLVSPMLESSREHALVRSIIDIGKSLDIETVAEGVETFSHALRLRELGCTTLQGYAFAAPLRAEDLPDIASKHQWKLVG